MIRGLGRSPVVVLLGALSGAASAPAGDGLSAGILERAVARNAGLLEALARDLLTGPSRSGR